MKLNQEHFLLAFFILYITFFTHPPPSFIIQFLNNPIGQIILLSSIVYTYYKSPLVGLLFGISYLVSSLSLYEFLDEKEQSPQPKQPKSGAPKIDAESIGKLSKMLGKGGKLPTAKGKDVTEKPKETQSVKPHKNTKLEEHFSPF